MLKICLALLSYGWLLCLSQPSYSQEQANFDPANNTASGQPTPSILIVIDDIGHSLELGKQAIELPGPVHFAILPHSQYGAELATLAHRSGQEVILHTPMSTINGRSAGPGELSPQLNQRQFINTLNHNLTSIPHLKGLNNHMGSLLTQMPEPMNWLMREIKRHRLYFLDSRTSAQTVAEQTARQFNIPNIKRDIFLDNDRNTAAIRAQFERLLKIASQNGHAVAIGHPYPETLDVLREALPALPLRGYRQALASKFLQLPSPDCSSDEPFATPPKPDCQADTLATLVTDIRHKNQK